VSVVVVVVNWWGIQIGANGGTACFEAPAESLHTALHKLV
jgi:hypothetical protein